MPCSSSYPLFGSDELAAGIAEVEAAHSGVDIEFDDTMVFVIAEKPA